MRCAQVYTPQDWDFSDGSFFLDMREAPAIGQRFDFEYTGVSRAPGPPLEPERDASSY